MYYKNELQYQTESLLLCLVFVIEFLKNQERATVTFSQGRYKSRMRKLAADGGKA